jgi:hypothetical protein
MSRFIPPDHSLGNENTIGGYQRVHGRPAAFDARDGLSYSVAIIADHLPDHYRGPYGAYFLFLRWRRIGKEGVAGHIESDYLEFGKSREEAMDRLGAWTVEKVEAHLDALIELRDFFGPAVEENDI